MTQLREPILQRLQTLLGSMSGIQTCARNRAQLSDKERPGILLLDGAETIISHVDPLKVVRMPPAIFALKPQIIFVAKERDTASNDTVNGVSAPIGPELTHWLELTQNTLLSDQELINLCTPNGQIIYLGHDTDFAWGSSFIGAIQMHFSFTYPFYPPVFQQQRIAAGQRERLPAL